MLKAAQRVVVIQDASREISLSAIKWALDGLSLKPGDELTLLGVLHQVNNPSTFSIPGAGKRMGYKSKVDSTSMLGASEKIISEELTRKEQEYQNSTEILQITKLYDARKVIFHKRVVVAASSPKVAAVEAVKELEATWIILDRQVKRDKKYFLERLSCGISRMKRNNIELLREPKPTQYDNLISDGRQGKAAKYEMLPGPKRGTETEIKKTTQENLEDDDLFSLELSPMSKPFGSMNIDEYSSVETSVSSAENPHTSGEGQSSANIPSSNGTDPEVPTFSEEKQLSQLQGEDNLAIIRTAKARSYIQQFNFDGQVMEWAKAVENIQLEQYANIDEAASSPTSRSAKTHRQEPFKNPVCSYCENGKPSTVWKYFSYAELQAATKDFSDENFLSEGGFGSVYKGKLENGHWVAVKQHKDASLQGEKEFISEVHVLSKARHKNVVTLLGSCSEGNHHLLVYEFICNSSLDKHLSECRSKVLSWRERIKIALGAASGLSYLHENNIIHRDMKPNNILVTHAYEALIGDFGLARTKHDASEHSDKNILGAFGYLAPEYAESGKATTKTDVYSFGVVLLELITGQTINKTLCGKGLVGWARPLLRERRYPELIDEKIQDSYDLHQLFWMVSVAEGCLSKDPDKRPTMKQVEDALQCIMDKKTVSGLEDYSLSHASISSTSRSNESLIEQETTMQGILVGEDSSSNEVTQVSEAFWTASTAESPSSRLLSSPMSTDSTFSQSRTDCKKRRPKFRISQHVSYDEMLS